MLSEEILEELRKTRNIALREWKPDQKFIKLLDEILEGNNETTDEYEDFLHEPSLEERQNQALCIIRQLKEFYRAQGAEVYGSEDENELLIRTSRLSFLTKITTNAEYSMVIMKVILPVEADIRSFNRLARMLHNCNEDPDVGFGFFNLDDATAEVTCVYRYSFAGGTFTEEDFHRYYRSLQTAARQYLKPIQDMAREPEFQGFEDIPLRRIPDVW